MSLEAGSLSGVGIVLLEMKDVFHADWGSLDANKASGSADAMLSLLVRALGLLAETAPMLPHLCWVNIGH